jgi:hypothetical protein
MDNFNHQSVSRFVFRRNKIGVFLALVHISQDLIRGLQADDNYNIP